MTARTVANVGPIGASNHDVDLELMQMVDVDVIHGLNFLMLMTRTIVFRLQEHQSRTLHKPCKPCP